MHTLHAVEMQSSHRRLISRILHSPVKGHSRVTSVGGLLHLLLQVDDNGAVETHRSFRSLIPSSLRLRGVGVRCSVSLDRDTPLTDSFFSHRSNVFFFVALKFPFFFGLLSE